MLFELLDLANECFSAARFQDVLKLLAVVLDQRRSLDLDVDVDVEPTVPTSYTRATIAGTSKCETTILPHPVTTLVGAETPVLKHLENRARQRVDDSQGSVIRL